MTLTTIKKAGLDELALDHVFTIGASGTDHYTFQGEGLNGTVNDPTLYLTRGKTYRFENGSGGHPIRIQSTSGASGTAYNTGVTNNAGSGTVIMEVQHDAPDVLYYQCTSHANMNGVLYITGALADGGVTTAKLADQSVTTAKLGNSAAGTDQIAHGAVVTIKIADANVTTAKIADDAVTNAKVAPDAIGNVEIANNAVTNLKIGSNAISTVKIQDGAVTDAKIASGISASKISGLNLDSISEGNSTAEVLDTGTNGIFRFSPEGTEKFRIDTDGNVGIGTAFPTTPDTANADNPLNGPVLTVFGDSPAINLTSSTTGTSDYSLINFGRGGGTTNPYRAVIGYKQSDDILRINAQNHIAFDAGGGINASERMRIDGSGNVGIGTTSPSTTLSVVNDSNYEGFNVKHSNGTQGIGIGYDHIKSTGSSTNVPLYLESKGTGHVEAAIDGNSAFRADGVTRDFTVLTNKQGWSTQTMDTAGAITGGLRRHVRRLNNGQNSVSTHNLFRVRRHNWGTGFFEVRIYYAYYSGSYMSRWRLMGHGANGDNYSTLQVEEVFTNGGGANWGASLQTTTGSNSSPGDNSTYYCDVQCTLPNYTYAVCEMIISQGYNTDNASAGGAMGSNSYTLWTP